jgi:hypothetical protein
VVAAGEPNVKPKAGVVDVETTVVEPDGVTVGDGEMEESGVEGKPESVGIGRVPMVLATLIFTEGVGVAEPDAGVAEAQSVADTMTVDTIVTVTMLFVPMTTVGVAIPFAPEEDVVAEVPALGVMLEMGLETLDVGLRVGSDDVVAIVEEDEEVKI